MLSKKLKIIYIIGEYPSHSESFIINEILELIKYVDLSIVVLKKKNMKLESSHIDGLITYVPPVLSIKILQFLIQYCISKCGQNQKLNLPEAFSGSWKYKLRILKRYIISLYINENIPLKQKDYIHAHFMNYPTDIAMFLSKISGKPFGFTAHACDIYIASLFKEQKLTNASLILTCSKYNKKILEKYLFMDKNKLHSLYLPVNLNYWKYNIPRKDIVSSLKILSVARLVEKKGLIYLLEAVYILYKQGIKVECTIVGRGSEEDRLKKYCKQKEINNIVSFKGWQRKCSIRKEMAKADLFVLPSIITPNGDRDGIPCVLMEAMASGVPVISTSISGIPELIEHKKSGYLVTSKNVDELVKGILFFLENDNDRVEFSKKARQSLYKNHDETKYIKTLLDLYLNAIFQ